MKLQYSTFTCASCYNNMAQEPESSKPTELAYLAGCGCLYHRDCFRGHFGNDLDPTGRNVKTCARLSCGQSILEHHRTIVKPRISKFVISDESAAAENAAALVKIESLTNEVNNLRNALTTAHTSEREAKRLVSEEKLMTAAVERKHQEFRTKLLKQYPGIKLDLHENCQECPSPPKMVTNPEIITIDEVISHTVDEPIPVPAPSVNLPEPEIIDIQPVTPIIIDPKIASNLKRPIIAIPIFNENSPTFKRNAALDLDFVPPKNLKISPIRRRLNPRTIPTPRRPHAETLQALNMQMEVDEGHEKEDLPASKMVSKIVKPRKIEKPRKDVKRIDRSSRKSPVKNVKKLLESVERTEHEIQFQNQTDAGFYKIYNLPPSALQPFKLTGYARTGLVQTKHFQNGKNVMFIMDSCLLGDGYVYGMLTAQGIHTDFSDSFSKRLLKIEDLAAELE
ncbi:uncharacterized protein LOC135846995 [Planococcus citri]|uniref:uncharacterized protein LOC135846995 n=1 Tax=Planococcus citri TaxID=170843 RepID=UPI0031F885FB